MLEKPKYDQTELITNKGELEETILDFSNYIFYNKKLGIILSIIINSIYIYLCYHKIPIISFFIFLFFLYLLSNIIIYQFKGTQ